MIHGNSWELWENVCPHITDDPPVMCLIKVCLTQEEVDWYLKKYQSMYPKRTYEVHKYYDGRLLK